MLEFVEELDAGHGLATMPRNRSTVAANGRRYGGVAIISDKIRSNFVPFPLVNALDFEVVAATSKLKGVGKVAVVGAYIPPNYTAARASECIEYISDVISELKRRLEDCHITLAGNFNQWPIERICGEHPDMREVVHGPTRGDQKIDKTFVNFFSKITKSDTLEPLEDKNGGLSNHRLSFFLASFPHQPTEKISFTYRPYSEPAAEALVLKLATLSWNEVLVAETPDMKEKAFQAIIDREMDHYFPLKTTTRIASRTSRGSIKK